MDAGTHTIAGILIGALAVKNKEEAFPLMLTGALAMIAPDADAVIAKISLEFFEKYHRMFTHTVFAAPFLAAIAAIPACVWMKRKYLFIYVVSLAAVLGHLALDVLCWWRIMLFYPLSDKNFALNLFDNKDTSYMVLAIVTIAATARLYFLQKRFDKIKHADSGARK